MIFQQNTQGNEIQVGDAMLEAGGDEGEIERAETDEAAGQNARLCENMLYVLRVSSGRAVK